MSAGEQQKWSADQTELARQLYGNGAERSEYKRLLGRSKGACLAHLNYLNRGAGYRRDRPNNLGAPKTRRHDDSRGLQTTGNGRPSPEMIQEAATRLAAPRTLAQTLMGDPLPGQSALDKRLAGVS